MIAKTEIEDETLVIGTRGVARMLNVSERHIERLDASQLIPKPVWIGRSKRWRLCDIREWLKLDCPDRATWEGMKTSSGIDSAKSLRPR